MNDFVLEKLQPCKVAMTPLTLKRLRGPLSMHHKDMCLSYINPFQVNCVKSDPT